MDDPVGHFNGGESLLLAGGCTPTGKSKDARKLRRQYERRLLKQSQEPKPNKPTKGFK